MIKFYVLLGLLLCLKARAGIVCQLDLAHTEDLHTTIARGEIKATDSELRSISIKDFFLESQHGRKSVSLAIQAVVVGWSGEEELSLAMFRRRAKNETASMERISQKVSLRGDAEDTLWFASYKLDIKCGLSRSEAPADS